jgi:nucleotide-binding universal stress UspA family protein
LATAWDVEPAVRDAVEEDMREAAEGLSISEVEMVVVDGPAGPSVAEAARGRVDLLVTGSRAYGPVRTVLLGSVSRHLVDNADCPVLVVPRSAEAEVDREPQKAAATA